MRQFKTNVKRIGFQLFNFDRLLYDLRVNYKIIELIIIHCNFSILFARNIQICVISLHFHRQSS